MEQIIYRPYKKQDFGALSEIINITWEHEKITVNLQLSAYPMHIYGFAWQNRLLHR